ncbi:MAG: hypothetical protein K6G84_04830 [Lachnospiraceae bacterium]|nr:hypothetical protein [Lachnospiraceae bacterium]
MSISNLPLINKLDLSSLDYINSININNVPIYALDISDNIEDELYVSMGNPISLTAEEKNGVFALPLPEWLDLSSEKIFNISEDVEAGIVSWEKEEDIPRMMSYCYMLNGNYEAGEEYREGKDFVQIQISIINNVMNLPEGTTIQLNEENFFDKFGCLGKLKIAGC